MLKQTSIKLLIIQILYARNILSKNTFYYWKREAVNEDVLEKSFS